MKNSKFVLAGLLVLSAAAMAGCGGNSSGKNANAVKEAVKEAMTLDRDALLQKAADELQDGDFYWVGTSSRASKAEVYFKDLLAAKNPKCANAKFHFASAFDSVIYSQLITAIDANAKDAVDGCLLQDGYQMAQYTDYFVNYIPKEWTGDRKSAGEPFSLQFNFKTWFVNNGGDATAAIPDNVWDMVTGPKVTYMDINSENINRDWLIMLTSDANAAVLKEAYEDATNDNKDKIDVSKFASYGETKKYAYAFIDAFLRNSTGLDDDGNVNKAINQKTAKGAYGWQVYSKLLKTTETEETSNAFLVSPTLGNDNSDGKTATNHMKGFSGFMYKHFLQVSPKSKHPYTTCALINILSTTAEGYKAWGTDVGDYPTMASINVDRTKNGWGTLNKTSSPYKFTQGTGEGATNLFPVLNDPTGDWWIKSANAVVEDVSYIGENYKTVNTFIKSIHA